MDIFSRPVSGAAGYDVPAHTMESLRHYLLNGWEPGGFVSSVLALDMERSVSTADVGNRHRLWCIAKWIMEYAPREAWGSYAAVDAWCQDADSRRSRWAVWYELNKDVESVEEPLF